MHQIKYFKTDYTKLINSVFNLGMLAGLTTLIFGLISCSGSGGGGNSGGGSVSPTISYVTAIPPASGVTGIIAASAAQPLTIYGTNFVSGVSISITDSTQLQYVVSSSAVQSSTKITAMVVIGSVPTDSYVTVKIQPPTGNSVSSILGVAHAYKTIFDVQGIMNTNGCGNCHNGGAGGLFLINSSVTASNLINTDSLTCSTSTLKVQRVTAGDPRRAKNVLVDVLKAKSTTAVLSCNNSNARPMPQSPASAVSDINIEAIVDWIALGAN